MLNKNYFIFLLLLLLSGCSMIQESKTPVEWQSHQERLKAIESYSISGKLGYISPEERRSLNLYLTHSSSETQLRLSTFMGQTVLKMTITPTKAVIDTYDNQHIVSVHPQISLYKLTGLLIPIEQLQDWLIGLPKGADRFTLNETHTLATLQKAINHSDWTVDYKSYQSVDYNNTVIPMPYKLSLKQSDIKLNLMLSKWKINQ